MCISFGMVSQSTLKAKEKAELNKVLQMLQKVEGGRCAYEVAEFEVTNGKKNEPVFSKVIMNGNKSSFENQYSLMRLDEVGQVIIMKSSQQILIKDINASGASKGISVSELFSKSTAYVQEVGVSTKGGIRKVTIRYPDMIEGVKSSYTKVEYSYVVASGVISEIRYYMGKDEKDIRSFAYTNVQFNKVAEPFKGKATESVFNGTKLKEIYRNYSVKDLRGKQQRN